ncbi:MAG: class I SAM-dependent methyltransferase [Phycisphaerae bacterium]|nr:class I SAM-dependent methyltransferase [Phycisphaerae bacterium]MCZ2398282.1 class I SAM-dependent methyltransferase [Phycisphaerae bacterium]NUQ49745.1 class I SAM-dependent methyltransferase [Phycisphaerae bacterium]
MSAPPPQPPDYRQRFWERYASAVHRQREPVSLAAADAFGRPFDIRLRGWLPERRDAAIVDVACGYGRLLRFFTKRGYTNVLGVDISAEEVELARTIHPNVVCADAIEFLEAHASQFDLVTAIDVIEHMRKDELLRFLDAARQALRPGGRIIIHTPNADSPWVTTIRYGDFTHELALNPNALGTVMELCGFERFEAREGGPVASSVLSAVRMVFWQVLRLKAMLFNVIETGSTGSRVLTRVFLASAVRPVANQPKE